MLDDNLSTMTTPDTTAAAYAAWTSGHKDLLEAEMLLANLGPDASSLTRDTVQRRVHALRQISDGLLELAAEILRRHEAEKGTPPA